MPAKKALATESLNIYSNPVAWSDRSNTTPNLFNNTHHLMPHGYSRHGTQHTAMLDVQITGANAAKRYTDNGITLIFQFGFRFVQQFKPPPFNICICKHTLLLSLSFSREYNHYIHDKRTITENIRHFLTPVRIRMTTFADRYITPHINRNP
jgi:hypothetical protein